MRKAIPLLAALLLLPGCADKPAARETMTHPAPVQSQPAAHLVFRTIDAQGAQRRYAEYVPRTYDAAVPSPLVIFLNGSGECGADGIRQCAVGLLPAILASPHRWPCIVLFPQKPESASKWSDYDAMVMAMLAEARSRYNIDPARITLTGLSQGGAGTWALGAAHPGTFAALAPICGFGEPAALAPALKATPVWAFHGEKDNVVLPEKTRAIIAAIEAAGGHPRATYFPEANHNSWDAAYQDPRLAEWLLAQRK